MTDRDGVSQVFSHVRVWGTSQQNPVTPVTPSPGEHEMTYDDLDRRRYVLAFSDVRERVLRFRDKEFPDGSCRCDNVRWDRDDRCGVLWHENACPRRPRLDADEHLRDNLTTTSIAPATAPTAPEHGPTGDTL